MVIITPVLNKKAETSAETVLICGLYGVILLSGSGGLASGLRMGFMLGITRIIMWFIGIRNMFTKSP